jgi:hypothetical protein
MIIGKCALCLLERPLIESHYLPAALYRLVRNRDPEGKIVQTEGSSSALSTFEFKTPLLCSECEKRFSENGEKYTLKNCYRKEGQFGLQTAFLKMGQPVHFPQSVTLYKTAGSALLQTDKLVYFAVSVFWRSSVFRWRTPQGLFVNRSELGPYEDRFRRYLLGQTTFPEIAVLLVNVSSRPKPMMNMFTLPVGKRIDKHHMFVFAIPGIDFTLFVGPRIPAPCFLSCAHHSPEQYVGYMDNDSYFVPALLNRLKAATPKGKLVKDHEVWLRKMSDPS